MKRAFDQPARRMQLPPGCYLNTVNCLNRLRNHQDREEWIAAVEQELFGNATHYGDKTGYALDQNLSLSRIMSIARPARFIFPYRDGRDVVASGLRHAKTKGIHKESWATKDPHHLSMQWANAMDMWERNKKSLDPDTYTDIRMEDYVDNPVDITVRMANVLQIDQVAVKQSINKHVNSAATNTGYHQLWIPDWKERFDKRAIQWLEKLEYIR
jgi:hypothetical protein